MERREETSYLGTAIKNRRKRKERLKRPGQGQSNGRAPHQLGKAIYGMPRYFPTCHVGQRCVIWQKSFVAMRAAVRGPPSFVTEGRSFRDHPPPKSPLIVFCITRQTRQQKEEEERAAHIISHPQYDAGGEDALTFPCRFSPMTEIPFLGKLFLYPLCNCNVRGHRFSLSRSPVSFARTPQLESSTRRRLHPPSTT